MNLTAIREAAKRLHEVGIGRTGGLLYTTRDLQGIMAGNAKTILRAVDDAEKDGTTRMVIEMAANVAPYYTCIKCGAGTWEKREFCPGCGRKIERWTQK